jgi:hypothetical protein
MTLLCPNCFNDSGLKRRIIDIRPQFPNEKCQLHPNLKGVPVKAIAEIVDAVFRVNYDFASQSYNGEEGESLEEIILDLTGAIDYDVARAVVDQLIEDDFYWPPDGEEAFYDEDAKYERSEFALTKHSKLWDDFRTTILHEQRFFNAAAKDLLAEIFDSIHLLRSYYLVGPVYIIKPGGEQSGFYRARVANEESMRQRIIKDIAGELGPPPARGRRAGRMNPAGISTFYGAFDLETCIAELRPSVGSYVMGAKFTITEPLCVLDTTLFQSPPKDINIFSLDHIRRSAQWRFMCRFMTEIGQPISPTDEHLDYIPTQAVAEYLLHHHKFSVAGEPRKIEAIIYRSAQNPEGRNIAILGEAAKVGLLGQDRPPEIESPAPKSIFSIARKSPEKFRIAAQPQTVETRLVTGASYTSTAYNHDHWPDGTEDF